MPAITACNSQMIPLTGVSASQLPALTGTTLYSGQTRKTYAPGVQPLLDPRVEQVVVSYSVVRSAQTGCLDFYYTLATSPPNTNKPGIFSVSWDLCPNIVVTYADYRTDLGPSSPAGSFVYGPGVNQFRFVFSMGLPAGSGTFFVSTNAIDFVPMAGTVVSFRNNVSYGAITQVGDGPTMFLPSPVVAKDQSQGPHRVAQ